jgi:hypothetical protein
MKKEDKGSKQLPPEDNDCDSSCTPQETPNHKRLIKGKRVFICPYEECKKAFTESGNLKTHIRIHVS